MIGGLLINQKFFGAHLSMAPDNVIALTREHHGEVVWPGEQPVLLPPPLGHKRDVEAEEEGDVACVGTWGTSINDIRTVLYHRVTG